MLRFPNPGSTASNFVAVYVAALERYRGQVVDLDNIVQATVKANLATSSGHMGEAAISRSTRKDRSRDPLFNQLKMYAELFRSLGWLHSTEASALNYTFTLLGEQVAAAGRYWRPLLAETVLGIANPSHVLRKRSNNLIRPFAAILRTMLICNEGLSRDEMIVGPLSAASDRTTKDIPELVARIKALREHPKAMQSALVQLKNECGIQINTLRNYTRWPLGVMRDLGWTEKRQEKYRRTNQTFEVHALTSLGKKRAESLEYLIDLRVDQVDELSFDHKRALARHAHFAMMKRAGFNLSSVAARLQNDEETLRKALRAMEVPQGSQILFSPFQSLSVADSSAIFPTGLAAATRNSIKAVNQGNYVGRGSRDHLFVVPTLVASEVEAQEEELEDLRFELRSLRSAHPTLKAAAHAFAKSRSDDKQAEFYPLVTHLLQLLGFECDYSRPGVNYQRWDACVWLNNLAVPIEIKSPTEELFLSTKAIRQAVENKVILLARGGFETRRDLTSLIVGYQIPNERGDMSTLIDDICAAFGFNIGVLDFWSLGLLAIRAVTESMSIDKRQLSHLKGFLDV